MKFCLNSCKAVQIRSLWRTFLTGISQKKVGNLFQAIFLLSFDNIATLNWRLFLPDNSQTSHYESFIEPKIRQKHSNEFSNVFFSSENLHHLLRYSVSSQRNYWAQQRLFCGTTIPSCCAAARGDRDSKSNCYFSCCCFWS